MCIRDRGLRPGLHQNLCILPLPDQDLAQWTPLDPASGRPGGHRGHPLAAGSNSFAGTTDPAGLQAICDRLGPGPITVFAERWWARLPLPLTPADRTAGYWWDLSMRKVEVSARWCSTGPPTAGCSSTRWSPTTWMWVGRTRSN